MARRAVIVGVTDYIPDRGEKPGLQRLPAGVNDAEAIAQVLKDPDWHDSYQGAPIDGSVWKTSNPTSDPHVLRGGSWILGAADCRASSRDGVNPDAHGSNYGFRVAYSLE